MVVLTAGSDLVLSQADTAWKVALENFLEQILLFCFPEIHALIDWDKEVRFAEQEMHEIFSNSETGGRRIDKLIWVTSRENKPVMILIHIEVQSYYDPDFERRMFQYCYRILDKYGLFPVSGAILADHRKNWTPKSYEHSRAGNHLFFQFPTIKLLDFEGKRDILEADTSPFACILLAQLDFIQSRKTNQETRMRVKVQATKRLYDKGFSREQVRWLFYFIDALICIPKPLELEYRKEIFKLEEQKNMVYVSSIERLGREEGLEQGLQQGRQEGRQEERQALLSLFTERLVQKGFDSATIDELTRLSPGLFS
jgi:hypothetical protein